MDLIDRSYQFGGASRRLPRHDCLARRRWPAGRRRPRVAPQTTSLAAEADTLRAAPQRRCSHGRALAAGRYQGFPRRPERICGPLACRQPAGRPRCSGCRVKWPLLVRGMWGLGDNCYARPFVRAAAEKYDVWLETPWPELYEDIELRFVRGTRRL